MPTLTLDDARWEFSRFLAEDPAARWRMDAALAHVVNWAFKAGIEAGSAAKTDPVIQAVIIAIATGAEEIHLQDDRGGSGEWIVRVGKMEGLW